MVSWFRDSDRLTPFIKAFRPMIARELDSYVEEIHDEMVKNWEQGQNIHGEAWAPNAPSTLRQKNGSIPLIDLRDMIGSTSHNVRTRDLSGQISIEDEEGKVMLHEHGAPDRGVPARPILAPVAEYAEDSAGGLLGKAFDRSWAQAARSGTNVGFNIGSR